MLIATNQPYKFNLTKYKDNIEFCFLDSPCKEGIDEIILMCADIFGDSGINEIRELTALIRLYPKSTPCFLLGVKTRVPDRNWSKYKSPIRDKIIREFIDEILSRSKSVGTWGILTRDWLIEFFGYSPELVDDTFNKLPDFLEKNNVASKIDIEDVKYFYRSPVQRSLFSHNYERNIYINSPKIEKIGGGSDNKIRYYSDIRINGIVKRLWLETTADVEKYLLVDRADAFLFGILPYALRYNHDIICESPVTEEFLHNIIEILIPHLIKYDKHLYDIKIQAEVDSSYISGTAVGTAVSGGVDSFYTIQKYYNSLKYKTLNLTHLYVGNYLYDGEGKKQINSRASKIANDLKLPLVITDTNISQMFDKHIHHLYYHIYKTFFGVLALRKLWKIYYYSSTYDYGNFKLDNNTVHDTAYVDLLTLSILNVPGFTVICGGASADRLKKTQSLADFPITYKYLNVCLDPSYEINCSKCDKCLRTMFNLDMCGKLYLYKDVFDVDYFTNHKIKFFERLITLKNEPMNQQAYEYYSRTEPEDMKQAEENLRKH